MKDTIFLNTNAKVPNDLNLSFVVSLENKNIKQITDYLDYYSEDLDKYCSHSKSLRFAFTYGYGDYHWIELIDDNDEVYTIISEKSPKRMRWVDILQILYKFYKTNKWLELNLIFKIRNPSFVLQNVPNHNLNSIDIDEHNWIAHFGIGYCDIYSKSCKERARIKWKDGVELLVRAWEVESSKKLS